MYGITLFDSAADKESPLDGVILLRDCSSFSRLHWPIHAIIFVDRDVIRHCLFSFQHFFSTTRFFSAGSGGGNMMQYWEHEVCVE